LNKTKFHHNLTQLFFYTESYSVLLVLFITFPEFVVFSWLTLDYEVVGSYLTKIAEENTVSFRLALIFHKVSVVKRYGRRVVPRYKFVTTTSNNRVVQRGTVHLTAIQVFFLFPLWTSNNSIAVADWPAG